MVNSYFLSLFPCVCLSLFHVLFVPISLFLFFLLLFFLVTATKAPFRLVPTTVVAYVSVFLPLRLTPSLCLSSPSLPSSPLSLFLSLFPMQPRVSRGACVRALPCPRFRAAPTSQHSNGGHGRIKIIHGVRPLLLFPFSLSLSSLSRCLFFVFHALPVSFSSPLRSPSLCPSVSPCLLFLFLRLFSLPVSL